MGVAFTLMTTALIAAYEDDEHNLDPMGGLIAMGLYLTLIVISLIFSFFIKEDLRRLRLDKATDGLRENSKIMSDKSEVF